jgi:hypothetical protein
MTEGKIIPIDNGNGFCNVEEIFPECLVPASDDLIKKTEKDLHGILGKDCRSSKIITSAIVYAATSLLIRGDKVGFEEYRAYIESLKIPDYSLGLMDLFGMAPLRPIMHIPDYFPSLKGDRFYNQTMFADYLVKSLKHCRREYKTKNGRCDLFIDGKSPFLVELKIGTVVRKDIHQCWDYVEGTDEKYPIILIGRSINGELVKFAEKLGVSVYTYHLKTLAPITVSLSKSAGESFGVLDRVGSVEFFPPPWEAFARQQGWAPKGVRI